MMSGWLPPCHEGAADCRPDRFLLSVCSCASSLAHLRASTPLQPFLSIEIKRVSRVIFIHKEILTVARACNELLKSSGLQIDW